MTNKYKYMHIEPSLCTTCSRDDRSFKNILCLSNKSSYAKEIDNAESAYESGVKRLAKKYGISTSIPSTDPPSEIEKIKSILIKEGHEYEVSEMAIEVLKSLDPIMKKFEELGMVLSESEPFNYTKPFDVIKCPSYKPNRTKMKDLKEAIDENV